MNKKHSFHITKTTDTVVSDICLLTSSFLKVQKTHLQPKTVSSKFQKEFLADVKLKNLSWKSNSSNKN